MRSPSPSPTRSTNQTRRDLLDISVGYTLIVAALWSPLPWSGLLLLLGFAWVIYRTLLSGAAIGELGLRISAIRRDYWLVSAAVLFALGSAGLAFRYNTLHPPFANTRPELHAGAYLLWALVQQFILQSFFLTRLVRVMGSKFSAAAIAATLFAVAHVPNPLLVATTLVWGLIACVLFLRYRDLYTLGVVHAVLGLSLAFTIPAGIHHQMKVGLGYLRYQPEPPRQGTLWHLREHRHSLRA